MPCQAGNEKCFFAFSSSMCSISGSPGMHRSICSQRAASSMVAVGEFFSALAGILSYETIASLLL